MQTMTPNEKTITFSCQTCEYNIGRNIIGCGGHCLKKIMYEHGGFSYLKNDINTQNNNKKPKNGGTRKNAGMDIHNKFKLVVCEKPSVAMQFARLLKANKRRDGYMEGNGWRVSWCLGHLVHLAQPDEIDPALKKWRMDTLPILPEQWSYLPEKGKEKQLNTLKKLMNAKDVWTIINACDAGREGELIFRLVYSYSGTDKPFARLWIHSMEDKAVLEGFNHLRPGSDFDHLYHAALCRSQADWLIGINATRKYGILAHRVNMTIGRVQSPTLVMLAERSKEIESFEPVPYYNVHLNVGGVDAVREKLFDQSEADELAAKCNGQSVTVKSVERKEKNVHPPKLYDLTMLQRDANRLFGYSARVTLDAAQKLYEMKLISYPRTDTDSQYIPEDMQKSVKALVGHVGSALNLTVDFLPNTAPIADSSKVSDHYALLPTATLTAEKVGELDDLHLNILSLIVHRLLCATSIDHICEETVIALDCGGEVFIAKGKRVVQMGWKQYELRKSEKEEKNLPELNEGEILDDAAAHRSDHMTTAPDAYTEDALLAAMENAGKQDFMDGVERSGLGTPATRATIIEKVISSGYAQRKGKRLIPTELGRKLADVLPEQLRSADLTAKWENDLLLISEGKLSPDDFMKGIHDLTRELVDTDHDNGTIRELRFFDQTPVGVCPRCSRPIYEEGPLGFFCSGSYDGCTWGIWKNSGYLSAAGVTLDRKLAAELIEHGRAHITNVRFENSNEGDLLLVDSGEKYPSYKYVRSERDMAEQNAA